MKKRLYITKLAFAFLLFLGVSSYGQTVEIRGGELKKAYQTKEAVNCSNYTNFLGDSVSEYAPAVGKKLLVLQTSIDEGYSLSKFDYQLVAANTHFFCLAVSKNESSFDMKVPKIEAKEKTDVYLLFEGPADVDVYDLKFVLNSFLKPDNIDGIKFAHDKKLPIEVKNANKVVASKKKTTKSKTPVKSGKVGIQLLSYVPSEGVRSVVGLDPSGSGFSSLTGRVKTTMNKIVDAFKGASNIKAILAVNTRVIKGKPSKTAGTDLILISTKGKVDHKAAAEILGKNIKKHVSKDPSVTGDAKVCYSVVVGIGGPRSFVVKLNDYTYLVGDRKVFAATSLFRSDDRSTSLYTDNTILKLVTKATLLDGIWGITPRDRKSIKTLTDIVKKLANISMLSN